MKYHLRVFDNYHTADESEAYNHGEYDTYEKAESAAKAIVDEFLIKNWERGLTSGMLQALYSLNGEDPVILPAEYPEGKGFSASDYAEESAETICSKFENEQKLTEVQTLYQDAIKYASYKHQERSQKVKGTELPYVVHLSNVAMEVSIAAQHTRGFNLIFAIQVALLHDTIEDTATTYDDIKETFSEDIAAAVLALSKDYKLPKDKQIIDSISRIKKLQQEVWAVKLADRITNLQPPPEDWSEEKIFKYVKASQTILEELGEGNQYLKKRLDAKISEYRNLNKKFLLDKF
jgi:(p)ppGpp synthase/HD superfamily hydrolase